MTINLNAHSQISLSKAKLRLAVAPGLFLSLLLISCAALFIPSLIVRATVILVLGSLIFTYERYLGLPVPVTPGTMLWLGSTLSYVVGGLGTDLIDRYYGKNFLYTQGFGFGMHYLDSALLYLGLGLGCYAFGLWLVGQRLGPVPRQKEVVSGLTFGRVSFLFLGILYILPQVVRYAVSNSIYDNLVIGALQSIELVPMILFAFYFIRPHPRFWVWLILLAAALANPISGMLLGYGRSGLILALVSVVSTWVALVWYIGRRISRLGKLVIIILALFTVLFFGMMTAYRQQVNYNRKLSLAQRLNIAEASSSQFFHSGNAIVNTVGPLVNRLVELPSLELLGMAENGAIKPAGWTLEDFRQVIFAWVPKVLFPEKGVGYGRDIMVNYGLTPSNDNNPVTVLTDAFRRFGVLGVLGIYFFMGVASTFVAHKLLPRWGVLGLVFVLYFGLLHLTIYSSEVLEVFKLYIYRLPSSALVIYVILRLSGIWRPSHPQNRSLTITRPRRT